MSIVELNVIHLRTLNLYTVCRGHSIIAGQLLSKCLYGYLIASSLELLLRDIITTLPIFPLCSTTT